MMKLNKLTLVGLALGLSLATPVTAQEALDPADRIQRDAAVLRDRGRQVLHPGNPLELRGNEQGDNSFRSNTPGLVRSANRATPVDPESNYARRIAMYERGQTYHAALPGASAARASRRDGNGSGAGESTGAPDGAAGDPSGGSSYHPAWFALAALALGASVYRARRYRPASA